MLCSSCIKMNFAQQIGVKAYVLFTSQITSFISSIHFFGITIQLASEQGEIQRKKQTRSGPSTVCLGYNELKVLLPSEWGEVQMTKQT